ncbi:MAG TPA: GldG family protein [Thermodesulfobacteriota bacterium]
MRGKRRLLYGTNALVLTSVVLAILIIVNYLAFKQGGRVDATEGKLYSLSDQTVKTLEKLDKEVEVLAFFKPVGNDRREFQGLITEYERRSSKIKAEFIDPDKDPGIAKKYEVNEYGTVVLVSGDQNIRLKLADLISGGIVDDAEQEVTNSLIKLSKGVRKTVYFLTGHGERDIKDNTEPQGLGMLTSALNDEAYEVKELLLLRESNVPGENSILIVAAPKKRLIEREIDAIKKYLDGGGKAVFMIEPRSGNDLVSLLKQYGFDVGDAVIIDPSSKLVGGGDVAPIVTQYPPHDITEDFKFATLFPYSRTIDVASKEGIHTTEIAKTGEYSWAEKNFALFDQGIAQQDRDDKPGPLGLAAVGEIGESTRIAVFGSVDFVSNRFFDFSGNSDFFLNTISWISGDESLISIRPKVAREGKLTLTGSQLRVIFSLTVIGLPAIVLLSGIAVWWRRRNM